MRLRTKILLGVVAGTLLGAGLLVFANRRTLQRQWHCYRVATAESFPLAREEMAWFEQGPDPRGRLGELVAKWGTGNPTFDLYLAQQVADRASSELLREVFCCELQSRPNLLKRWAHYWAYQSPMAPGDRLASVVAYFEDLARNDPQPSTWRELLDLVAVFQWTDREELAARLQPTEWIAPFQDWQAERPRPLPRIGRPAEPLPLQ